MISNPMKWSQILMDEETGKNIVVFTTLVDGIDLPQDNLDDDDLYDDKEF